VTVSSVARAARVHRSFIHRHPDLLNARAQNARLYDLTRVLEARLSETLGEAVFRTSCLGAPDDIRSLQQLLSDARQQVLELSRHLKERTDELGAARAANRELMAQLNTTPFGPRTKSS
jgi:Uri superfamily endonuclease